MITTRMEKSGDNDSEATMVSLDDFHVSRPTEHKNIDQFTYAKQKKKKKQETFHEIKKIILKDSEEWRVYFLKLNAPSALPNPVSELEAVIAAYYRLIASNRFIPNTYAIFDKYAGKYIGVASEEIPRFKSTAKDPLKDENLNLTYLSKISIEKLEEIDRNLYDLEQKYQQLNRKFRKVKEQEKPLEAKLILDDDLIEIKTLNDDKQDDYCEVIKISSLTIENKIDSQEKTEYKEYQDLSIKKPNLYQLINAIKTDIRKFYVRLQKDYSLNKDELENYRIIKGLAIALMTSYIFMENDLHQNNFSKFGMRIDFDMSLWRILYHYKESKLGCFSFRAPTPESLQVSLKDLMNFPEIEDANPFYWPTKSLGVVSDTVMGLVDKASKITKPIFNTTNPYPYLINTRFSKLKNHPLFIYYKFKMLTKYILSNKEMYQALTCLHLRADCLFKSQSLHEVLISEQNARIEEFKKLLTVIDAKEIAQNKEKTCFFEEFYNFFIRHCKTIQIELIEELNNQNVVIDIQPIEENRLALLKQYELNLKNILEYKTESKIKTSTSSSSTTLPVALPVNLTKEDELKETKEIKESLTLLDKIKTEVIAKMQEHINPGFFGFFGLNRSQDGVDFAKCLKVYCEGLKNHPENVEIDNAAIQQIRKMINDELKKRSDGATYKMLEALKKKIDGQCATVPESEKTSPVASLVLS